jgi:DNA-binding NtrC family response regulator
VVAIRRRDAELSSSTEYILMSSPTILVVEPAHPRMTGILLRHGLKIFRPSNYTEALQAFSDLLPDITLICMPSDSATSTLELLRSIRLVNKRVLVILIVAQSSEQFAIEALNAGASRYLKQPVSEQTLLALVEELMAQRQELAAVDPVDEEIRGGRRLIGDSQPMCALRSLIKKLNRWNSNVLITGETGTGKELIAELIHANSPRYRKPFVCLNSAAIPDSLLESELFGHERGAFTGAQATYQGKLALADTGTIFFDEIGDISCSVQAKLLRALDGKQIYRLGGNKPIPLDIRIIAATNQNIETAVEENRFRRDLYYRLNVIRVQLSSLRERIEDIPKLLNYYVTAMNELFGMRVEGFTSEAMDLLLSHNWPGNIRELKNVVEAIFVNLQGRTIDSIDLPEQIKRHLSRITNGNEDEREQMLRALVSTNWNKTRAADKLHWSRMTLYRKMHRYQILRSSEKP